VIALQILALRGDADMLIAMQNVRYWPFADIPYVAFDVAFGCKADMTYCTANVCF